MPKFSIIVPAYNIEKYIGECLDSICSQSFTDYEVIIVDDGSTDLTGQICDEFSARYQQIQVIHQKNSGQAMARNAAIEKSVAEYILFVDGDDKLAHPHVLALLAKECNGNDLVAFEWLEAPNGKNIVQATRPLRTATLKTEYATGKEYLTDAMRASPLYSWYGWMYGYRLAYWGKNNFRFKPGIKYEDVELIYRVLLSARKVRVLKEPCYIYRIDRPGSTCTEVNTQTFYDGLDVVEKNIKEVLQRTDCSVALKKMLCNNFSCLFYSFLIQSSRVEDRLQQKALWQRLESQRWVCQYTTEKKQCLVRGAIKVLGIPATARLLGLRRKWQVLRGEKKNVC